MGHRGGTSTPHAAGGIRTHNTRALDPRPLPVGLPQRIPRPPCDNSATIPHPSAPLPTSQYRRQDSNLQPPDSETGASCRWATAANDTRLRATSVAIKAEAAGFEPARRAEHAPRSSSPVPAPNGVRASVELHALLQRRRRESNPRPRLCRPAPRHSATSSNARASQSHRKLKDSNLHGGFRRLPAFQAGAPHQWGQSFLQSHNSPADGAGFEPAGRSQGPTA